MTNAYIIDAVRTPRGKGKRGKGALTEIHPQELLAQALNRIVQRSGVPAADVDDVVVGCVSQVGEQGANIARNAVLAAAGRTKFPRPRSIASVALGYKP